MKTGTIQLTGVLSLVLFFFLGQAEIVAQEVSGVVTDQESQEPLPGVNIVIKGTSHGTSTDMDGSYSLEVGSLSDTLVFSYVGYQQREIPINGREQVDVGMIPTAYQGEEMVVVGYGTQRERTVTGAVSSVNSSDMEETPAMTTSQSLVGQVEGVTFRNTDARPGSGTDIQIRNMGNPLFVIDGVPADQQDFNQLGQGDIENISVLKDASAAVYGMRASNGVVLVTTKGGGFGQDLEVNVSGYQGWQRFTRYPQPANAYQFKRGQAYAAQNTGRQPQITPEELQRWKEGGGDYKSYDYFDIVMDQYVPQYQLKASASGGSQNISYYFAATHNNQDALITDFNYKRTNLQANIEAEITDGLTMGANVSGRVQDRHNVGVPGLDDYFNPLLSVFTMWPTESPYANDNPNYVHQTHNVNVNPATYDEDITGYSNQIYNDIRGKMFAEYEFDFGLNLRAVGQYDYNSFHQDEFEYTYDAYRYDEENDEYYTEPGWGNQNPWRDVHYRLTDEVFAQFRANYVNDFGKHHVDAMAAYEYSNMDQVFKEVNTVPSNNYIPIQEFKEMNFLIHDIYKKAHAGYVGRLQYNYDEKYMLEVLGRYDGSYLFPPDERWGLFPAISGGWRVSDEEFFQSIAGDFVSNFLIRASYGVTGSETWGNNNSISAPYADYIVEPFAYVSGYTWGAGSSIFNGSGVTGIQPRGLPVTSLSWIENVNKNLGITLGFLDNQLTAKFDIFERRRDGLPASRYDVRLPDLVGFSLPPENLESDAVRGFEGNISYNGRITDELSFTVGGNFTLSRRRYMDSYKPRFGNSWDEYRTAIEDRWTDITWGYQVEGRFQSMEEIENYDVNVDGQGNRTLLPGDFKYKDVNGDGVINGMDERPIGYAEWWDAPNPYMTFGLKGSFSYKGARLAYNFAGGTMMGFMRDFETRYPFQNDGNAPDYMLTDRWHRESPFDPESEWISGDYPPTRGPQYGHSNYRTNTYWMSNVTYLRLRNVTLSYNLPQQWLAIAGIKQVRVYAKGTNLFSIDNMAKYDIDPELDERNALAYPPQKMYTFGFNIKI